MNFTPKQAADIMHQIEHNQWKWLGVKRFTPDAYATLEDRYAALERHHADEMGRMIDVIKGLCRTLESLKGTE